MRPPQAAPFARGARRARGAAPALLPPARRLGGAAADRRRAARAERRPSTAAPAAYRRAAPIRASPGSSRRSPPSSARHAAHGEPVPQVVIDILGAPAWATLPAARLRSAGTPTRARGRCAPARSGDYRALVASLLALGRREGVALPWWAPWNEPNDPRFLSPQRATLHAAPALRWRPAPTRSSPARWRRSCGPPGARERSCCSASSAVLRAPRRTGWASREFVARPARRRAVPQRATGRCTPTRLRSPRARRRRRRTGRGARARARRARRLRRGRARLGDRGGRGRAAARPARARGPPARKRGSQRRSRAAHALVRGPAGAGRVPVLLPRGPRLPGGLWQTRCCATSTHLRRLEGVGRAQPSTSE